jgi:hypothetical protein
MVVSKGQLSEADIRSFHEAESIAHALDAFIADGVSCKSDGIEILVTRLIGLICAIQTNDWSVMSAIEYKVIGTNTLPLSSKQMAKLVRQGNRIKSLTTVAPKQKGNNRKGFTNTTGQNDGSTPGGTFGSKKKFGENNNAAASTNKSSNNGTAQDKSSSKSQ